MGIFKFQVIYLWVTRLHARKSRQALMSHISCELSGPMWSVTMRVLTVPDSLGASCWPHVLCKTLILHASCAARNFLDIGFC